MNLHGAAVSWLIFLLTSVLLLGASIVNASDDNEPSLWVGDGTPTKTLVAENILSESQYRFPGCIKSTEYRILYDRLDALLAFPYKSPYDGCWSRTDAGIFSATSTGRYMRLGKFGAVTHVSGSIDLALTSNGFSNRFNNGSSFFFGLQLFDAPLRQFELSNYTLSVGSLQRQKTYNVTQAAVPAWRVVHPVTNQPLSINKYGVSKNGKWMALEGSNAFWRLNVETREMLAFAMPMYGYGGGLNPSHELAITDDGRYAIVGGGYLYGSVFRLYDLKTCVPNTDPTKPAMSCQSKDLLPFAMQPDSSRPFEFGFSSDGSTIEYNLGINGLVNHYRLVAHGQDEHLIDYLALGDSFTSGEGDGDGETMYLPGTDGDGESIFNTGFPDYPYEKEKCHISKRSYPYLVTEPSLSFKSVACSGADVNDILNLKSEGETKQRLNGHFDHLESYPSIELARIKAHAVDGFIPGREAQIKFVQKYKPRVATIGIGGNDLNFANKLQECLKSVETCGYASDQRSLTANEIENNLQSLLSDTYRQLKEASPNTKFYAVGYPQLFASPESGCNVNVLLDPHEREYGRQTVAYINKIIKETAAIHDVFYLDIENSLEGKELCSGADYPAINGVTKGNDKFGIIGNESFHPNEKGHLLESYAIHEQLQYTSIAEFDPCASNSSVCNPRSATKVARPDYFKSGSSPYENIVMKINMVNDGLQYSNQKLLQIGSSVNLGITDKFLLKPSTPVSIFAYSEPKLLARTTTNEQGGFNITTTIPVDLEPGYHTIRVQGTSLSGEPVEMYEPIFVYVTEDDVDGDGILNTQEACGIIETSDTDQDRDGIDDACDPIIYRDQDTTPPEITYELSSQPNDIGWHSSDVTVTWKVKDDDSSVVAPTEIIASKEGEHEYTTAEICDTAGNCAVGKVTLKIDKTAPIVGTISWSRNPKNISESSEAKIAVSDAYSGVLSGEYFIGENDPGNGNAADMYSQRDYTAVTFGTDFVTGVYKMTFRVQDAAGNWSVPSSDYMVVYDPTSGLRTRGSRLVTPNLSSGDSMPGLITTSQNDQARFAFSARYRNGDIDKTSDFQLAYKTGVDCNKPDKATNCHLFELNASTIDWFTAGGINQSLLSLSGKGTMKVDGISSLVTFRVDAVDGERLGTSAQDSFKLSITRTGDSEPLYRINQASIGRGNIKIQF